ncbi:MAG: hypothetical protein HYU52_06940 [Acidobacteria bacterium]|nr:hypothetical protein [Acidobacteriota bacterium]
MHRKPRRRAALLFAALGALILAGAFVYWRVHSFNLRDVIPGEVYRVAQPGIDDIERAVTSMGLRSIVNLRGPNMRSAWYRDEVEVSRRLDVELVSLRFETFDWPPRLETLQFVDAIDRVPRPLLIHCHSGLDRSGWAAGVVRLLRGDSVDAARGELSLLEGHFCDRDECALHRFFDLYDEWLARKGRAHSPAAFREWLEGSYYPPPYAAAISSRGAVPVSAIAGTPVSFVVDVTNRSGSGWVATSDKQHGIRLGARILGPFDPAPADPIELFRVPHTPARDLFRDGKSDGVWSAGSSKEIEVGLTAPDTPGLYFIQVDMVDEMVHWFSDLGDAGLILPLRVEPAPAESRIQN